MVYLLKNSYIRVYEYYIGQFSLRTRPHAKQPRELRVDPYRLNTTKYVHIQPEAYFKPHAIRIDFLILRK